MSAPRRHARLIRVAHRVSTLAAMLACGAAAAAPLAVSATYDIRLNGIPVAVLEERYEARDGAYRLTSASNPIGIFALAQKLAVRFTSTGSVTSEGLRPQRFEGRRARDSTPEVTADFDWPGGRLTMTHGDRTEQAALPPGAQDRLSVMYEFMFIGPRQPRTLEVAVTNGRRLDRYSYEVTPDVEQETALGRVKTLHLVRRREAGDGQNEIWLAPAHGYLPVRMIIVERDGTRYEQRIAKLELEP